MNTDLDDFAMEGNYAEVNGATEPEMASQMGESGDEDGEDPGKSIRVWFKKDYNSNNL